MTPSRSHSDPDPSPSAHPPVLHSISTVSLDSGSNHTFPASACASTSGPESVHTDARNWPYECSSMTTSIDDGSFTATSTSLESLPPHSPQLHKASVQLNPESEGQDEICLLAIDHHLSSLSSSKPDHLDYSSSLMDAVSPCPMSSNPAFLSTFNKSLDTHETQVFDSNPEPTSLSIKPTDSPEMASKLSPNLVHHDEASSNNHSSVSTPMSPVSSLAAEQVDHFKSETEDESLSELSAWTGKVDEEASIEHVTKLALKGPYLPLIDFERDQSQLDSEATPNTPTVDAWGEPGCLQNSTLFRTQEEELDSPAISRVVTEDIPNDPGTAPHCQPISSAELEKQTTESPQRSPDSVSDCLPHSSTHLNDDVASALVTVDDGSEVAASVVVVNSLVSSTGSTDSPAQAKPMSPEAVKLHRPSGDLLLQSPDVPSLGGLPSLEPCIPDSLPKAQWLPSRRYSLASSVSHYGEGLADVPLDVAINRSSEVDLSSELTHPSALDTTLSTETAVLDARPSHQLSESRTSSFIEDLPTSEHNFSHLFPETQCVQPLAHSTVLALPNIEEGSADIIVNPSALFTEAADQDTTLSPELVRNDELGVELSNDQLFESPSGHLVGESEPDAAQFVRSRTLSSVIAVSANLTEQSSQPTDMAEVGSVPTLLASDEPASSVAESGVPQRDLDLESVRVPVHDVADSNELASSHPCSPGADPGHEAVAAACMPLESIEQKAHEQESEDPGKLASDTEVIPAQSTELTLVVANQSELADNCSPVLNAEVVSEVRVAKGSESTDKCLSALTTEVESTMVPATPLQSPVQVVPVVSQALIPEATDETTLESDFEVGSVRTSTNLAEQVAFTLDQISSPALIEEELPEVNATAEHQNLCLVAAELGLDESNRQAPTSSELPSVPPALQSSDKQEAEDPVKMTCQVVESSAPQVVNTPNSQLPISEVLVPESTPAESAVACAPQRVATIVLPPATSQDDSRSDDPSKKGRNSTGSAMRRTRSMSKVFRSLSRKETRLSPPTSTVSVTATSPATSLEGTKSLKKKRSLSALKRKAVFTWRQTSEPLPETPKASIAISELFKFPGCSVETCPVEKCAKDLQSDEKQTDDSKDNTFTTIVTQAVVQEENSRSATQKIGSPKACRPSLDSGPPRLMPIQPTNGGVGDSPVISTNTPKSKKKRIIGVGNPQQRLTGFLQKLLGRKSTNNTSSHSASAVTKA
ncbi:hypothetical protein CROQUDRAFT_132683 [Cronartium quercuum f. sp. fusiforme G11]|uniref:Uncharacterized protein n=1 Tax=Cronartium quercuum f. sp. fusiforme G11 TaxID=708437 RepID=A0A9P6NHM5_9BASI|nr:hypothetical protein CROQUDRAFT_132683 [Cronartium quercuum f. sp. fusiforme G11]